MTTPGDLGCMVGTGTVGTGMQPRHPPQGVPSAPERVHPEGGTTAQGPQTGGTRTPGLANPG